LSALGGATQGTLAPLGRRRAEIVANEATGGYRIIVALDREGPDPDPGQFYMLATERGWGEGPERPFLPRAFSVAEAERAAGGVGVRLTFLLEGVGPGTRRLASLRSGEGLLLSGPLGCRFSQPPTVHPEAAGAILVGGGIGIAPLALLRRRLAERGVPLRTLLGFRDQDHCGGLELFRCTEVGLASEDGRLGHCGYVTELLERMLLGDEAGSAVVYACGPPAMLEAVRVICAQRGVPCELALEAPMACGFGACFGCAVPLAGGGFMRLCVDGPVVRGERIETALIAGGGGRR
jgi:NAD(P)H-flavin reductase